MIDQSALNTYFSGPWRERNRNLDQYEKTGWALINKIRAGESVVDVGCGDNPFKGCIANLVGFDPAFDQADYKLTLEEFCQQYQDRYNVAFCLGSINFGTQQDIERQIGLVDQLLSGPGSRIYWRCNPGSRDHGNAECETIPFYNWSFAEHIRLTDLFGYRLAEVSWDTKNRIYAEWIKL
jgi:hypothetical protein